MTHPLKKKNRREVELNYKGIALPKPRSAPNLVIK